MSWLNFGKIKIFSMLIFSNVVTVKRFGINILVHLIIINFTKYDGPILCLYHQVCPQYHQKYSIVNETGRKGP